jgi:hypothetical protein
MHSFFIEKFDLDFIEYKFLITSLYLHEMLNSVISLQIMLFWTYNIYKSSFEHHIYDIKQKKWVTRCLSEYYLYILTLLMMTLCELWVNLNALTLEIYYFLSFWQILYVNKVNNHYSFLFSAIHLNKHASQTVKDAKFSGMCNVYKFKMPTFFWQTALHNKNNIFSSTNYQSSNPWLHLKRIIQIVKLKLKIQTKWPLSR